MAISLFCLCTNGVSEHSFFSLEIPISVGRGLGLGQSPFEYYIPYLKIYSLSTISTEGRALVQVCEVPFKHGVEWLGNRRKLDFACLLLRLLRIPPIPTRQTRKSIASLDFESQPNASTSCSRDVLGSELFKDFSIVSCMPGPRDQIQCFSTKSQTDSFIFLTSCSAVSNPPNNSIIVAVLSTYR